MSYTRLLLLFVLGAATHASAGDDAVPRLRTDDRIIKTAIARGRAQSITFQRLVARIAGSDVIVHVTRRPVLHRPFGVTRFVAATPHSRYLRITLDANDASDAIVALLGHELQHAVEAADASAVTDQDSYRALYRGIGHAACGPPRWCFDTAEAVEAGARVYAELRGWSHTLPRLTAATRQRPARALTKDSR